MLNRPFEIHNGVCQTRCFGTSPNLLGGATGLNWLHLIEPKSIKYMNLANYLATLVGGDEIASLSAGYMSRASTIVATALNVTLPMLASVFVKV